MALQALLPYLPAITKGLSTGLGYAFRPKRRVTTPAFPTTAYGGLLQRRAREGTISPRVRGGLMGRYGRTIGGETQKWQSGVRGGLVSRNMLGSISGLRALGEPERYRTGLLGEYGKELDIESEMSKQRAEEELQRLSTQYEMQRRAEEEGIRMERGQARMGLLGGLGEAGMGLYGGLMGRKLAELGGLSKEDFMAKKLAEGVDLTRLSEYEAAEKEWERSGRYGQYAPYVFSQQAGISLPYGVETGLLRREQFATEREQTERERIAGIYISLAERLAREGSVEEAKKYIDDAERILGGY